jgi:hypothetical protein
MLVELAVFEIIYTKNIQKILIGCFRTGKRNIYDYTHTDKKRHLWEKNNNLKHD